MANEQQKQLTVETLLERLNEWRFYPKFQLERHFDVLLSFILPELLWKYAQDESSSLPGRLKVEPVSFLSSTIIPEFPLPLNLFDTQNKGYLAKAADFAVFIPGGEKQTINTVLFVELKTDESSTRDSQTDYMRRIQSEDRPFSEYLEMIIEIILNSEHNARKYLLLLKTLTDLVLLQHLDEMFSLFVSKGIFYKKRYLIPEKIISHQAKEVECNSLIIAPGAVVDKIKRDPGLEELPTLGFEQAAALLKKDKSDVEASSGSPAKYLKMWNESPMNEIRNYLGHQKG